MKDHGQVMSDKAKDTRDIQMGTDMKESFTMAKLMVKEFTLGLMGKSMMVNGEMVLRKVTVFGKVSSVILILESGEIQKLRDMECINGKMGTGMKVNGWDVLNMDKEQTYLRILIHTLDSTSLENLMDLDNTNGKMVQYI